MLLEEEEGAPVDASPTPTQPSQPEASTLGPEGWLAGGGGGGGKLDGYKRAYPIITYPHHQGEIDYENPLAAVFRPHVQELYYARDAEAVCVKHPRHQPPEPKCECGFYALKERPTVQFYNFSGSALKFGGTSAVLTVHLYGREVIEGARGYRGAAQQVHAVQLDPRCAECDKQATVIGRARKTEVGDDYAYYTIEVLCGECGNRRDRLSPGRTVFEPAELSGLLGVEVTIAVRSRWILYPRR